MNIKLLLEGEEEVGSPYLEELLVEHAQKLACDFVVSADGGQLSESQVRAARRGGRGSSAARSRADPPPPPPPPRYSP